MVTGVRVPAPLFEIVDSPQTPREKLTRTQFGVGEGAVNNGNLR